MEHRRPWTAHRRIAVLSCCLTLLAFAPLASGTQPLACSPGSVAGGGLYASGSGLLGGLSLGWGGAVSNAASAAGAPEDGSDAAGRASCAPSEPASIALDAPSTLAGNPVDVVAGTKLDRAIDAYLPSPAAAALDDAAELVFSRFYASDSPGSAALGPGWRMGLDVRLYASGANGRRLPMIVQGDGREVMFGSARAGPGPTSLHVARAHEDGVLEQRSAGRGTADFPWVWRWRNGRELVFDADGRLRRVVSRAGSELALDYDGQGRLSAVRSASGRGVRLRYHDAAQGLHAAQGEPGPHAGRLAALLGSAGAVVRYDYDRSGRLARLRFADGARLAYVYADDRSRRLAAVVLPDGRRSEYRYRPDGRVVYTRAAGDPDALAIHLDYRPSSRDRASGETLLRIGGELRATYRWAKLGARAPARLLSALGPGCVRCPVTGRTYRYDAGGRLLAVRHWTGNDAGRAASALEILRDASGRPRELRWGHGQDRRVRISWRDDRVVDLVERVDRPSVVSGLRAEWRPVRDGQGRIVALEERGFAPSASDANRGGDGDVERLGATPVRRIWTRATAGLAPPPRPRDPMPGAPARGALSAAGAAQVWRDDFGRVVALRSPDFGLVRRGFDEHDRLRFELRADGSSAHYGYGDDGLLVEYRETAPTPGGGASGRPADAGTARDGTNATSGANTAIETTRFRWSQGRLSEIDHDALRETLTRDPDGRLIGRRTALRLESGRVVEFDTRFEYDAAGRLNAWSLPGGGRIRAYADPFGQVVSLEWQPTEAPLALPLVGGLERDRFGLRRAVFGNGVVATTRRTQRGRLAEIRHLSTRGIDRGRKVLDHRFAFDADGRLVAWWRDVQRRTHGYDADGRLLQAISRDRDGERRWRFAYDASGNRVLAQRPSPTSTAMSDRPTERFATLAPSNRLLAIGTRHPPLAGASVHADGGDAVRAAEASHDQSAWDDAGRLTFRAGRSYEWDAGGRLREVREGGRTVARYRYDALGLRVSKLVDGVATHYLYDTQRRLLAELDAEGGVRRQYVYLADRPVAALDRVEGSAAPAGVWPISRRIRYLHLNHLGAPEAVTDERARVIWRAEYAPFGRRLDRQSPVAADAARPVFELALRLPGQYEDRETGLHYNDHRYYDPDTGRYLSPDPLGYAGGPNPYVYADNDPLTRIDPSGLLLFAFDGTDNGDPPARRDDWSNVYKLSRSYSDGRVWYMAGVGRDDLASGIQSNGVDSLNANTARARVDYLLGELDAFVSTDPGRAAPVDVDVIGFSRGAAMARDFSNRVADRIRGGEFDRLGACVRLRFLGLWDTVAQFGADGIGNLGWRLAVPEEAAYAAQAVALNEHRTLFPAESIVGSPLAGVRIERGFVGAHSDVGGSYAQGDLSDVALIWMHAQAQLAGVRMFALTSEFARVTAPLLHDSNTDGTGDREFRYRNDWGWVFARPMQRVARVDGMQWSDTARFILPFASPQNDVYGEPTIVGSVDMQGYSDWLAANYAIAVPSAP